MKKLLLILLLSGSLSGMAQPSFVLDGTVAGLPDQTVYLLNFYGERTRLIDSVRTNARGSFHFSLSPDLAPGMYRVSWGKDYYVDLICNRENVRFQTDAASGFDSLVIEGSVENRTYYDFMRSDRISQAKLELLQPIVDYYPEQDAFFFKAAATYEQVQHQQEARLDSLKKRYPDSYAVRMLTLYSSPFLSVTLTPDIRLEYLKQHYFDGVDFSDTALLRSNAWPNKAISYLALYGNNRLSQKQLETEFIKAVTVMLSAAGSNPDIFKFLLDYLVSGFDKFHFEEVTTYLAENFEDPYSCEDAVKKSELQKKLETFKKIAIGQPAPALEVPDSSGTPVNLYNIGSEYTLLLFWSSECGHCTEMLPRLKAIYDAQKPRRYEVMAVSIDTDRHNWLQIVREDRLDWINVSDLLGFDGVPADQYNIYATPTMFLLDREKKILAKPISFRELEGALKEQGLY